MIGSDDVDSELSDEPEKQEPPPWSALFLGGAKVVKSAYKKRRSRSVDLSPRPSTALGRATGRPRDRADKLRRRSSSIDTPEKKRNWVDKRTRILGASLPTACYNPPKFQSLDFSLNESELENGPGSPIQLHINSTNFDPNYEPESDDNSIPDMVRKIEFLWKFQFQSK